MTRRKTALIAISSVLAIAVTWVYVKYYLTPSEDPALLQTTLALCTPELLAEKNPILITDRVFKHEDLLGTVFKYQHVYTSPREPLLQGFSTRARFTLLFSDDGGTDSEAASYVDISHPVNPEAITRVVIRPHETLVLPPMWRVGEVGKWVASRQNNQKMHDTQLLHMIQVYDIFHLIFKRFV